MRLPRWVVLKVGNRPILPMMSIRGFFSFWILERSRVDRRLLNSHGATTSLTL